MVVIIFKYYLDLFFKCVKLLSPLKKIINGVFLGLSFTNKNFHSDNRDTKPMLDKKRKEAIIKKFRVHETDSGSNEVQIAILSEEIKELADHLKTHKKDFSSRRGLLRKIGQRRKLLKFLEKDNPTSFDNLAKKLKLKKVAEPEEENKNVEDENLIKVEEEEETME